MAAHESRKKKKEYVYALEDRSALCVFAVYVCVYCVYLYMHYGYNHSLLAVMCIAMVSANTTTPLFLLSSYLMPWLPLARAMVTINWGHGYH